jgi:5'-deoxynucleotidase YfbR-like HD superfamily hydrolase
MKIEDITEDWILQEIEKLKYTYGLNKVVRYNLIREEIYETQSVAEHVTNMLILAHYFRELEDPERKMDMEKNCQNDNHA